MHLDFCWSVAHALKYECVGMCVSVCPLVIYNMISYINRRYISLG